MRKKGRARAGPQPVATAAAGHREAGGGGAVGACEQFTYHQWEGAAMNTDSRNRIESTLWKLDLIKQAVRGIAHRGTTGDIGNAEDETLPVEDLINNISADLDHVLNHSFEEEVAA
jgi:hypothetical protein